MIANADAVVESAGVFAIRALAACLDGYIEHLTDFGRIGYENCRADPGVFVRRAEGTKSAPKTDT